MNKKRTNLKKYISFHTHFVQTEFIFSVINVPLKTLVYEVKMMRAEWLAIARNKMILISIIGVILIPSLYSGIFVWAFWDPYGMIKKLPVAMVNLDQPVQYKGDTISVGNDIIDELRKDHKVKWEFVSEQEGVQGLRKNRYYAMIQIPKDFSKNLTSVIENKPKRAKIEYIPNTGYNFVSTKITDSASEALRKTISENITEHYTSVLFNQFGDIYHALNKAHNGGIELVNGLDTLHTKSNQLLSGLKQQQPSIHELATGSAQLYSKTAELSNGLLGFEKKLDSISSNMKEVTKFIDSIYPKLQTNLSTLNNQINEIMNRLNQTTNQMEQLKRLVPTLQSDIQKYTANHPETANDPNFQAVLTGIGQLSEIIKTMNFGKVENQLSGLSSMLQSLKDQQLSLPSKQLNTTAQLDTYLNQFRTAANGSIALKNGAKKIAEGTKTVENGWGTLIHSVSLLTDGEDQLLTGAKKLSKGLNDLKEAIGAVKGANNARNSMFAAPVEVKRKDMTEGITYGAGFTPYFLSLGLFVGPLMLTTIYNLRDPVGNPTSGLGWLISKYSVLIVVILGQSLITALFLLLTFHLAVQSIPLFLLFSFISSLAFGTLIMFLAAGFGNPGKFVALVALILQLTTSGGSYPVELIAPALQPFHRFLPMSYAVAGLRDVMFTGDFSAMWHQAGILAGYFIVSLILLIALFVNRFKKLKEEA
ncbi:YhgE/Pip family protein [Heyndrickxia sp. NPDC080065]|uniref:YhgE/Pip domain-containing protein n=1 Tax=Heyndrickxia sp. NPDC080065 TaxID=3390568 RepID=UPI003D063329